MRRNEPRGRGRPRPSQRGSFSTNELGSSVSPLDSLLPPTVPKNIFDDEIKDVPSLLAPLIPTHHGDEKKRDISPPIIGRIPKKARTEEKISPESGIFTECSDTSTGVPFIGQGTTGRPIHLVSNFFKLRLANMTFFQYNIVATFVNRNNREPVEIDDSKMEKFMKNAGSTMMAKYYDDNRALFDGGRYVFDGQHVLFTTKQLISCEERELHFRFEERDRHVMVKLQHVGMITSDHMNDFFKQGRDGEMDQRLILLYDVLMRQVFAKEFVEYRRRFFDFNNRNQRAERSRNGLVEFAHGFVDSVRPAQDSMALNLHLTTGATISSQFRTLADFVCGLLQHRGRLTDYRFQERDFANINKMIKGLKVYTSYGQIKRIYTVAKLDPKTPSRLQFDRIIDRQHPERTVRTTVKEYHRETYGHTLEELPMIRVTGRKDIFLPLEKCNLEPNQFLVKSKINPMLQAEQLRVATKPAEQYMRNIAELAQRSTKIDPNLLDSFGVQIHADSIQMTGRQLDQPDLSGEERSQQKFHKTTSEKIKFAIFILDGRHNERNLREFENQITRAAAIFRNLTFAASKILDVNDEKDLKAIFSNANKHEISLIFLGLPERHQAFPESGLLYNLIKHFGDQKYGIVTQCFNLGKLFPNNRQGQGQGPRGYYDNIMLKVNAKLDGQNTVVREECIARTLPTSMSRRETMIVGIDVNHSIGVEESSIAACVGSFDSCFYRYGTSVRMQAARRDEMVDQLDVMIEELMTMFHKRNTFYPKHLIIYRDGVSEGQFEQVLEKELPAVRKAVAKLTANAVKITLLIVQKRHLARFMLADPQQGGRGRPPVYNVPSGTVVDNVIVERGFPTFYLNSHFSPLGISKSSKYVLLVDENIFNATQLQTLTFFLCFSCARTRKPISIPIPVRYADLAAYRGKAWINARIYLAEGGIQHGEVNQNPELVAPAENIRRKLYYA